MLFSLCIWLGNKEEYISSHLVVLDDRVGEGHKVAERSVDDDRGVGPVVCIPPIARDDHVANAIDHRTLGARPLLSGCQNYSARAEE